MEKEISKIEKLEAVKEVFRSLSGAVMSRALYPAAHPVIIEAIERTYRILVKLLKGKGEIFFGLIGNELVFEDISLSEMDASHKVFIDHLKERNVERISFLPGLKGSELERLVECLSLNPEELAKRGGISKELSKLKVSSITCGRLHLSQTEEESTIGKEILSSKDVRENYKRNLGPIKDFIGDVRSGRAINLEGTLEVVRNLAESVSFDKTALLSLATLKVHDDYTFTHALNVSLLTVAQGRLLGFREDVLSDLGIAAMLHDIGKEFVPAEILRKPSRLTEEEMEKVRRHPVDGAWLLRKSTNAGSLAQIVAFEHHLGYDLNGYPKLGQKRKLNIASMMTTISDHYDAMTTIRPYRRELLQEEALRIMLGFSGKIFEPTLLNHFVRTIGLYKEGDFVKLDTGEIGIVHKENQDLLRPQVKIVRSKDGEKVSKIVSLKERDQQGEHLRSILSTVELKET